MEKVVWVLTQLMQRLFKQTRLASVIELAKKMRTACSRDGKERPGRGTLIGRPLAAESMLFSLFDKTPWML